LLPRIINSQGDGIMKYILSGAAVLCIAAPVFGAAVATSPASAPVTAIPVAAVLVQPVAVREPVAQQNIMRAGTEVPLITREDLTTKHKKLRVGQRFQMEVASNVEANGIVVLPIGTPAIGEVTEVRNKGMWGKSGYINARVISLRLGDRTIRLSGTFDDKGVTGTAAVVGAVAFVPVVGFFTTGTSAQIPTGSPVKAFLDEDIAFRTVAVQPQAIEIPVSAPAPVAGSVATPIATPASIGTPAKN
jgi:hypothetical protein